MKIFLAMPHFIKRQTAEVLASGRHYASHTQDPAERLPSFFAALSSFVTMFPDRNVELQHDTGVVGGAAMGAVQADSIDVSICTSGEDHILDLLPPLLPKYVKQISVNGDPMHLGFACHQEMIKAYREGDYDFFVYAEDDIALFDRHIFEKISWFENAFGEGRILSPNRYEIPFSWHKIYVDGALPESAYKGTVQGAGEIMGGTYGSGRVEFVSHANPMAGCFFLTRKQMARLVDEPSFGAPSKEILSYLETAQTLPLLKQFKIYKPTLRHAAFAEVQHTGTRLCLTQASRRTLSRALG